MFCYGDHDPSSEAIADEGVRIDRGVQERSDRLPKTLISRAPRVLIVDDEVVISDLLVRKLTALGYACECCDQIRPALALLERRSYDLLLADVMIPELGGVKLLKETLGIRPDLAVILITSIVDIGLAVELIKAGAYDYITKPFSLEEVSVSVARALEKRRLVIENKSYRQSLEEQVANRTQQLNEALEEIHHTYHSTLMALGTALDSRETDVEGHSFRVALYATHLANKLGVEKAELRVIQQGAILHDIGKIGISDEILRKPGKLSETEWILMKRHPEIGFRILSGIKYLSDSAKIVLHHHERVDGKGYPSQLEGEAITLGARIFAVADTLDCMTSHRPFQKATTFEEAQKEIMRVSGTQLDPGVVEAFLQIPPSVWKEIRHTTSSRMKFDQSVGEPLAVFNDVGVSLGLS